MSDKQDKPVLVYDRQCPVCDLYCQALRTDDTHALELVDARSRPPILADITARGIDIDQNMVLKLGDRFYAGPEAIHQLALITAPRSCFNRVNIWIHRSPTRARLLYPVLRTGRNLLLKLLRRTKINNLQRSGNDRF